MNVLAIIQARTGSTRLPNKIFSKLGGKSFLYHVVERLRPSKEITDIIVATTTAKGDDKIEHWCSENKVNFFRGSEENVLERYYKAAKHFKADIVVRVTADDPFKDYRIIDEAITTLKEEGMDFVCNNNPVSFPEGLDVEVMTFDVLELSYNNAISDFEREHVTQHIHRNKNKFRIFNIINHKNLSNYRWTVDTKEDYIFAKKVYEELYDSRNIFLPEDIYKLLENNPDLMEINKEVGKSDLYK
ncbi:cytidylyltransferase domain-containing protein [Tenacibaculum maritimum]|uniref:cytidylyltransferase domain-containing protein n=1 Tax=Tenacibaculum maritimum TaxID=107401 RepID=UPI0010A2E8AB|nr:glycosyltransferase family protein [Tenacibaculum maritimum]MCD9563137.1 glycosyltransferase family protein [Tenacibaculum maritimum]MCD9565460.1 glycosyltransferase family protein [Tenacibaculum maritimum]MCD9578082.1 glycosyltransferase family protein [Tenacibaculum maritimum]MCD9585294.1 glycosyltransferase family protein [Tenacibaculum maritimum]MCD9596024.1 glycosyltransferase family protein [Tenacibaculum maritimum]